MKDISTGWSHNATKPFKKQSTWTKEAKEAKEEAEKYEQEQDKK